MNKYEDLAQKISGAMIQQHWLCNRLERIRFGRRHDEILHLFEPDMELGSGWFSNSLEGEEATGRKLIMANEHRITALLFMSEIMNEKMMNEK